MVSTFAGLAGEGFYIPSSRAVRVTDWRWVDKILSYRGASGAGA